MKNDVVYILKNDIDTNEIRYSLRSVEKNFPFNSVWFYGGKPEGIEPDHYVCLYQQGKTKWDRVSNTLRTICENDEITEDFWLFNDDFFVMEKVERLEPVVLGTLAKRVQHIKDKNHGLESGYAKQLKAAAATLKDLKLDTLDYAAHYPILINRKKAQQTLKIFNFNPMFRSLYGNHHRIGGTIRRDCKIMDNDTIPKGWQFVSTSDRSWNGKVGRYVRKKFAEPSRWER